MKHLLASKWTLAFLWVLFCSSATWSAKIPINIGVGPTLHTLPGPLEGEQMFLYGLNFDFYAAVPGKIAHRKAPKKYKKLVNKHREAHIFPIWFYLIPKSIILHNDFEETGVKAYGARWSGLSGNLINFLHHKSPIDWSITASFPSISYIWLKHPKLDRPQDMWLFGASVGSQMDFKIHPRFRLTLSYLHHFYLPLEKWELDLKSGSSHAQWHHGEIGMLLNFRFPVKVKI